MSLLGARILVTRPEGGWEELRRRAGARGGQVDFRAPTMAVTPSDPAAVRAAAAEIGRYSWVVLTSARGVGALADALGEAGHEPGHLRLRAACVGPATERAARAHAFDPALTSAEGRGADLAATLSARLTPGDRVLVVRPETGSAFPLDLLVGAGAAVTAVAFYATRTSPEAEAIAGDLQGGRYDVVVVTAPSALAAISPACLGAVRRVALGATTANALADAGVPSEAIAARPTADAVADALESLC